MADNKTKGEHSQGIVLNNQWKVPKLLNQKKRVIYP